MSNTTKSNVTPLTLQGVRPIYTPNRPIPQMNRPIPERTQSPVMPQLNTWQTNIKRCDDNTAMLTTKITANEILFDGVKDNVDALEMRIADLEETNTALINANKLLVEA